MLCFTCGHAAGAELQYARCSGRWPFITVSRYPKDIRELGDARTARIAAPSASDCEHFGANSGSLARKRVEQRALCHGRQVRLSRGLLIGPPPPVSEKPRWIRRRGRLRPQREKCGCVAHHHPSFRLQLPEILASGQICQQNQGFTKITEKNRVLVSLANES